jgi:catechol 2,3-dioxygenase-like lactoylglutathione lyase family enzyme
MIETHGLTHISLAVNDPQKSVEFYTPAFGVREYYRDDNQIQVQGPGPFDVLAFERNPTNAGVAGGITHFGFRLKKAEDISRAVAEVQRLVASFFAKASSRPVIRSPTLRIPLVTRSNFGSSRAALGLHCIVAQDSDGSRSRAPCSVRNVRVGGSKIERGERAVDCFALAIKLHAELPDAQFLFDEHHEIDKPRAFELPIFTDTGPQAPFVAHR